MDFEIRQGDALTVLRSMPDESVQCAITSPPYYGLRSYNTEPQVWGGICPTCGGCDHVWEKGIKPAANGLINNVMQGETLDGNSATRQPTEYAFCRSCNAWRGELGLEPTFQLYLDHLIEIFAEVKRVLKKDGVAFVNLGDSYSNVGGPGKQDGWAGNQAAARATAGSLGRKTSLPPKSLMQIPSRFSIRMTDELQMILRNEIIWHKRACMPSSAKDRFTVDFEPIYFFAKSPKYKFNQQLEPHSSPQQLEHNLKYAREYAAFDDRARDSGQPGNVNNGGIHSRPGNPEGRNKRTTWTVNFEPSSDAHYASYPTKLVEPMVLAGSDEGDVVMDIFNGTATTGLVALRNRRRYIGIELNPEYIEISKRRLRDIQTNLF